VGYSGSINKWFLDGRTNGIGRELKGFLLKKEKHEDIKRKEMLENGRSRL